MKPRSPFGRWVRVPRSNERIVVATRGPERLQHPRRARGGRTHYLRDEVARTLHRRERDDCLFGCRRRTLERRHDEGLRRLERQGKRGQGRFEEFARGASDAQEGDGRWIRRVSAVRARTELQLDPQTGSRRVGAEDMRRPDTGRPPRRSLRSREQVRRGETRQRRARRSIQSEPRERDELGAEGVDDRRARAVVDGERPDDAELDGFTASPRPPTGEPERAASQGLPRRRSRRPRTSATGGNGGRTR